LTGDKELIFAAADLSRTAPREWAAFIAALGVYTDNKRDLCIQSPPDNIRTAQGRAQECVAIFRLLKDCSREADEILKKSRTR